MIVIEPHADDAFLSMGGIIERNVKAGTPVSIVTVYSGTRKRAEDAMNYAHAVGAEWYGLGFTEMGNAKDNGAAPFTIGDEWLPIEGKSHFGTLPMVLPLAITHPEHVLVRKVFEEFLFNYQFWYYVDQPYASKLKNQDAVNNAVVGYKIVNVYRPGAVKYRHTKLFKDQSKFFHFNPPSDLEMKGYELVVT